MNTAIINIKVKPEEKIEAQKAAEELGMPLSIVIKAFLKQFIRTKSVTFSVRDEIPNEYLKSVLMQAEKNYEKGNTSPAFKTGKEAVKYLEDMGI